MHIAVNQVMLTVIMAAGLLSITPPGASPGDPRRHILIVMDVPVPPQTLGRQTGVVLSMVLQSLLRVVGLQSFLEVFLHTCWAFLRDRAPQNGIVVKDAKRTYELGIGPPAMDLGCRQHDAHHCVGEGLQSMPRLLPRLVKATAAMSTAAVMYRFECALQTYLEDPDHFDFYVGTQPHGPEREFREMAMQLFWTARGAGRASAREIAFLMCMLNGNWQRIGVLEHYCPGPECCRDADHAREKLRRHLARYLFMASISFISQHRWTGCKYDCPP
jgi:hypothetical protein